MTKALILIDFQKGFDDPLWGDRNNPFAEENAARLLARFRHDQAPIFHIQHHSTNPDSPLRPSHSLAQIKDIFAPKPNETVLTKSVNSAFIGTNLQNLLNDNNVQKLTICGLTTPHCVSTTTRMAANFGYDVSVIHDACAAVSQNANSQWRQGSDPTPDDIHNAALDHLNQEFAQVISCNQALA